MTTEEASVFDGAENVHISLCCTPELVKYATGQLRDAAVMQTAARKARVEQAATREGALPRRVAPGGGDGGGPPAGSLLVPAGADSPMADNGAAPKGGRRGEHQ